MRPNISYEYRGWALVNTSTNYYSACKGPVRIGVGCERRGGKPELERRFRRKVDEWEATHEGR